MNRGRAVLAVVGIGLLALLWVPLLVVAGRSFVAGPGIPGMGAGDLTLAWYAALLRHEAAIRAAGTTVVLAFSSTAVATVLGTLLGYGLGRYRFRGSQLADALLRLPLLIPDVVLAVSLLLLFGWVRQVTGVLEPGLIPMILGHVSFQVPLVAIVVRARTTGLDPALEEAARDLGATAWGAFWAVTLPSLRPGIIAGALLALTLSLDDFAVSFFTSGPGATTLPVLIYASARRGITPEIHALSTCLLVATVLMVALAWRLRGRDAARDGSSDRSGLGVGGDWSR